MGPLFVKLAPFFLLCFFLRTGDIFFSHFLRLVFPSATPKNTSPWPSFFFLFFSSLASVILGRTFMRTSPIVWMFVRDRWGHFFSPQKFAVLIHWCVPARKNPLSRLFFRSVLWSSAPPSIPPPPIFFCFFFSPQGRVHPPSGVHFSLRLHTFLVAFSPFPPFGVWGFSCILHRPLGLLCPLRLISGLVSALFTPFLSCPFFSLRP